MIYKQYKAAKGSRMTDAQAERFGVRLNALVEKHGGSVTPEIVVNDARQEDSPLRDWFEWDDNKAAARYRLRQAREMLRSVVTVVILDERAEREEEIRAFHNIVIEDERIYAPVARVLTEADLRKQMVEQALRELDAWRRRYKQYAELAAIFEAIDAGHEQLKLAA